MRVVLDAAVNGFSCHTLEIKAVICRFPEPGWTISSFRIVLNVGLYQRSAQEHEQNNNLMQHSEKLQLCYI